MMDFFTRFFKSKAEGTFKTAARQVRLARFFSFWAVVVLLFISQVSLASRAAELTQLSVERAEDGVYLTANVQFELPSVVEDALAKGVALFFVAEADVYQNRWYWTDRRVASAARTIRLAFQPLTRRWRVNITSGVVSNSAGDRKSVV